MAKNVIGIDISDFSIEALSLEKHRGSFKVESYARFRLSPEIVEDGKILNSQKLKDAIVKMFSQAKPKPFNKSRKVFLSIPEAQTFSRVLSLPKNIKNKELAKVTINKAEELIPESIDRLTAITKILPETADQKQVFYAAAQTEVLRDFVSIFNELDIEVVGITTEVISSFHGLKKDKDKKNTLLLDLGARTTIASVFTDEYLGSSINIDIGGDNITKAIAKKLNISYSQAETKKKKIGLTSDEYGEIMLISQGQLQPLVDELKVFIKYWQETTGRNIEQVVLIGGLSQMKGIDKYFSDNLNLPTKLGQPFLDKGSLPARLESRKYINTLGLARLAHQGTDIDFYKKLPKEKSKLDQTENNINNKKRSFINIFKNIYFWIILAFLILASSTFIFYNKIISNNNIITERTTEEQILEYRIFVSIDNPNEQENFIAGQYYDGVLYKSYTPSAEEILDENYTGEFSSSLEILSELADQEAVTVLNNEYTPQGYYVIPEIISSKIIETIPNEEEYVAGERLEADIEYKFMMFREQELKDWLVQKYPELANKIGSLNYEIINSNTDTEKTTFNISVSVNKDL